VSGALHLSSCQLGKISHVSLASVLHHSIAQFEIVFSDVWGPAPVPSSLGHQYFVFFIDNYTRYTWIYFLKHKSEVFDAFIQFEKMIDGQFNTKIRAFQSDWGGEYQKLHHYFKQTGIQHRIACLYTHEQNGTAERKISYLVDTCLTLLAQAHMPLKY
jgi:hypothetical protein